MFHNTRLWFLVTTFLCLAGQIDGGCPDGYHATAPCQSAAQEYYPDGNGGAQFCSSAYDNDGNRIDGTAGTDFTCARACAYSKCCTECQSCFSIYALGCAQNPPDCPAGQKRSGAECLTCPANTYSNAGTVDWCPDCPANSNSPAGSSISGCTCSTGYVGNPGGPCTLAPAVCGAGSYYTAPVCVDQSPMEVVAGYTNSDNDWVPGFTAYCPTSLKQYMCPGHCNVCCASCSAYCPVQPETCTQCGPRKWSDQRMPYCSDCPSNSGAACTSSCISRAACQCDAGYSGSITASAGSCTQCVPGKFKINQGSTCTDCGTGKYSTRTGATSADVCTNCAAGQIPSAGSYSCQNCAAGSYSAAGSSACVECEVGKISQGDASSVCLSCPTGATSSPVPRTACICLPGYDGALCSACAAGKFKTNTSNTDVCISCAAGTYGGGATCTNCPAGSSSPAGSTVLTACTPCAAGGYSIAGSTCTACAAGTSSANAGASASVACGNCVAGKYASAPGMSACTSCAAGKYLASTGASVAVACVDCIAGKYAIAGSSVCTDCVAGTFSASSAAANCTSCLAGKYASAPGTSACASCAAGKFLATTGASASVACGDCVAGKYAIAGSANCTDCAANTYASVIGASACTSCGTTAVTTGTGSSSAAQCLCGAGKECSNNAGFRNLGGFNCDYVVANSCVLDNACGQCCVCQAAAACANQASAPPVACAQCAPGTFKNSTGAAQCSKCEIHTYASSTGAIVCTSCGTTAVTTGTGSSSVAQCLCKAGYRNGTVSRRRLLRYDEDVPPQGPATPAPVPVPHGLPAPTPAPVPAPQPARRLMQYTALVPATCQPCASSYYKSAVGNNFCSACPPGTRGTDGLTCVAATNSTPAPTTATTARTTATSAPTLATTAPTLATTARTTATTAPTLATTAPTLATPAPTTATTTTPAPTESSRRNLTSTVPTSKDDIPLIIGIIAGVLALFCVLSVCAIWLRTRSAHTDREPR